MWELLTDSVRLLIFSIIEIEEESSLSFLVVTSFRFHFKASSWHRINDRWHANDHITAQIHEEPRHCWYGATHKRKKREKSHFRFSFVAYFPIATRLDATKESKKETTKETQTERKRKQTHLWSLTWTEVVGSSSSWWMLTFHLLYKCRYEFRFRTAELTISLTGSRTWNCHPAPFKPLNGAVIIRRIRVESNELSSGM